jgi:hypothetical protein
MRAIEAEINRRRGEVGHKTDMPKTNFRGIELRDFAADIARVALITAEFQCDVTYRGAVHSRAEFLPPNAQNWITQGNALRLDWLSICPPTGTGVKFQADDLFHSPLDQAQIDFENEGGALLHKWPDGQGFPFPGQTYPTVSVTGMARAVKPFRAATRT